VFKPFSKDIRRAPDNIGKIELLYKISNNINRAYTLLIRQQFRVSTLQFFDSSEDLQMYGSTLAALALAALAIASPINKRAISYCGRYVLLEVLITLSAVPKAPNAAGGSNLDDAADGR
jgi:hypothetical protein